MGSNHNLFWYGFFAKAKKFIGSMLISAGLLFSLIGFIVENSIWILGIILLVIGIIFMAKGSSQRFDYQRKSGYIVHGGD